MDAKDSGRKLDCVDHGGVHLSKVNLRMSEFNSLLQNIYNMLLLCWGLGIEWTCLTVIFVTEHPRIFFHLFQWSVQRKKITAVYGIYSTKPFKPNLAGLCRRTGLFLSTAMLKHLVSQRHTHPEQNLPCSFRKMAEQYTLSMSHLSRASLSSEASETPRIKSVVQTHSKFILSRPLINLMQNHILTL